MGSLHFVATGAGVDENEDALIATVGRCDSTEYVAFQRHPQDGDDDWGVYFEFNDQSNSSYNSVSSCTLTRKQLFVALTKPIDRQNQVNTVDVELCVANEEFEQFASMLLRIFRGKESLLTISPPH